jgi:diguanylate cyclase (GGDEF)-like protein
VVRPISPRKTAEEEDVRKLLRRVSLLTRFGLISLALVALLGVVVGEVLRGALRDRTLGDAIRTAQVAANIGVRPVLRPSDLAHVFRPLPDARRAQLDAALLDSLSRNNIVRLKIWNSQHFVVWSDNKRLLQRWFPGDDELNASLTGLVSADVTNLQSPEELDDRSHQRLLSVYVPLGVDRDGHFTDGENGKIIGAFEIYLPYQPIAHAIDHDTRRLYLTLAIGLALLYLAVFRIVARASRDLRRQVETNRHQALYDMLTDLPNRVLFTDRLEQVATQAHRNGTIAAALLLDLDRFKEINDALGHESGDQLLCQLGARISKRLRAQDTVARLGGDEFGVVLPGLGHPQDAVAVAEDIAAALEEPFDVGHIEVDVRASIGVACTDEGEDAATLLRHADVAMYVAKRSHSGIELYSKEHDLFSAERLALASEVRRAIEQRELVLHYQPKIDLRTGRADSVEALVRWQHPARGLLGPSEFLPVVESTHLIKPLTIYVLDEALRQARAWAGEGERVAVSVNLAAACAGDLRLPVQVAELLARHDVEPELLEIELTETAVLDNPTRAKKVLEALAAIGVRLSVDDFGTGYASIAYLTGLPIRTLKIDQSFIFDLATSGNLAVTRYSIELARTLGLTTIAEGVEDETTLRILKELGCDEAQGFFFARALPADECIAWIRARNRTEVRR